MSALNKEREREREGAGERVRGQSHQKHAAATS
jgi:hypothetical protein